MATSQARQRSRPAAAEPPVATADEWEADSHHTIWTHGGKRIIVRIPDLFDLVRADALPDKLRAAALSVVQHQVEVDLGSTPAPAEGEKLTWETIRDATELFEHLAHEMIVEPELDVEQFRRLPTEDREMLRDIAMRNRNTDARGVWLGVEPLSRWEGFRRVHRCPEMCEACQALQAEFSTRSPL